jgi:integrase
MSRDTSARPSELLSVRIGDIKTKKVGTTRIIAEIENLGRQGNTRRRSRTVPLINSLQYLKRWLAHFCQILDKLIIDYARRAQRYRSQYPSTVDDGGEGFIE